MSRKLLLLAIPLMLQAAPASAFHYGIGPAVDAYGRRVPHERAKYCADDAYRCFQNINPRFPAQKTECQITYDQCMGE